MALGSRLYGFGGMALGAVCLACGDFLLGQPVPQGFPARTVQAYASGVFLVAAGRLSSGGEPRLGPPERSPPEPMPLADPSSRRNWSQSAIHFALIGAAWVVADSLARFRRSSVLRGEGGAKSNF